MLLKNRSTSKADTQAVAGCNRFPVAWLDVLQILKQKKVFPIQACAIHNSEISSLQADSNEQRLLASELRFRVEATELEAATMRSGLEKRLKSLSKVQMFTHSSLHSLEFKEWSEHLIPRQIHSFAS